jgi:transcriptional regulator with XRE-family HTH domain
MRDKACKLEIFPFFGKFLCQEVTMSKNLWELRKQRNLTVKQLAAKSGVPAKNIYAYEAGEQAKMSDLEKLAKALFVNQAEIKFQSDPLPKTRPEPPPPRPPKPAPPSPKPKETAAPDAAPVTKKAPPFQPATPGQLDHLRILTQKLGLEDTAVTERLGKPLDQLSLLEARTWLKTFSDELKTIKAETNSLRPADTRRWRAQLPEGVDEFEANYLLARQEAGDEVTFTMLNEATLAGRVIGFGPYNITIRQADGTETIIHKLALAYYQVAAAEEQP